MTMTTAQTGEGRKVKMGQKYKDEEGAPVDGVSRRIVGTSRVSVQ
jgi:hypothetical protein